MTVVIENGAMSSSLPLSLSQRKIGKIHSRFRHSFNICFEDELVNINIMENQLSSFGINIEKDLMSILLDDLKEDDLVNMDRNQLVLFPTFGEVYEINLGRLQIIDLALEAILPTPGRLSLLTDLFLRENIWIILACRCTRGSKIIFIGSAKFLGKLLNSQKS